MSVIIEYRSVPLCRGGSLWPEIALSRYCGSLIATLSRSLFNLFYIRLALDSSNWINICLDSPSRILESCPLMSLWLFCWWLWPSPCLAYQVCRKIIFCSFGMFQFFVRSKLFCLSFEYCWLSYHGIHSDCVWSIWASPAKFK